MDESGKEDYGQGSSIILDEDSNVVLKERTVANQPTEVPDHENEESDDNRKIETFLPLSGKNLDAFLQVNERHVESENVAGEARDIFQGIGGVGEGQDAMHQERPSRELSVDGV